MFKTTTLLLCLSIALISFSQTVSTISDGNFYDSIDQDSKGNIYCSDFFGNSVFKYDTNGTVTTFRNGFTNPNGIGINAQDEIFICDAGANIIFKYDLNGMLLNSYSTNVNNPTGIRNIPGTTDMLFVEYSNNSLKRLEANGTVTTLFNGFPLNGPSGIVFINGNTYVSNYNDRKIMQFENGVLTLITQLPATGPNNNALGFMTSSNNKIYATQLGAHLIYEVNPTTGNSLVYAGSVAGNTDGDISIATFNFPNGIYADTNNDRLYISDAGTSNLRIIENALLSSSEFEDSIFNLKVFVNQASDSLTIKAKLTSNEEATVKIFEMTGKEVFSKIYSISNLDFTKVIDNTNFSSGPHIIIFNQNGRVLSQKIIID